MLSMDSEYNVATWLAKQDEIWAEYDAVLVMEHDIEVAGDDV
jgi:hypothetical protein